MKKSPNLRNDLLRSVNGYLELGRRHAGLGE